MSRFTHSFRRFFVTEKQTPQFFSLLECMERAKKLLKILLKSEFEIALASVNQAWEKAGHSQISFQILPQKHSLSESMVIKQRPFKMVDSS